MVEVFTNQSVTRYQGKFTVFVSWTAFANFSISDFRKKISKQTFG